MTREEAIDVLKHNYPSSCYEDLCKAVNMAIKVLEQRGIIRCKDCRWSVEPYDTDENVPYWVCKNWDVGRGTDADGYCHEAERREDG